MVWTNPPPVPIKQLHQRPKRHRPEVNQQNVAAGPRRTDKSDAAFRTTGEVSKELELPAHVLRFWESKFPGIKPLKRGGGRRYYRPEDVDLLRRIRQFLYHEGYTIRGVQKLLREGGPREETAAPAENDGGPMLFSLEPAPEPPDPPASRQALQTALEEVRRELVAIRELLDKVLVR
jgi:DNA-binding transcriptional MerR regulator